MATIDRLRPIFERVLQRTIADFGPNTSPKNVKRWDSATHVALILEIEETFEVEFRFENLNELLSVGQIGDAVDDLCAARAMNPGD